MKKKIIAIAAVSTILIGGSALTISANNDGYHLYKTALKNTHILKNAETSVESSVKVNDETVSKIDMNAKYDLNLEKAQGTANVSMMDTSEQFALTYQNKEIYIQNQDNNKTFLIKNDNETENPHHDPELMNIAEKIFDTLTVPLHDDFKINDNKISVELTNEDIPVVFREIGQYIVKKGTAVHENATMSTTEYPFLSEDLSTSMPVLTDNIKIEKVKINAELTKNNIIENQTLYVKISGEDKDGKQHQIELNTNIKVQNINKTEINDVTFDESKVQEIELKRVHH